MLLMGLAIHYCCGVTSWAQPMFIVVDNILLSCGSLNNVVVDGRMFVLDNTSMLFITVVASKN
jgi:hypothetical protein